MQAPKRKTRTQKVQDGTGRVIKEKFLEQREQEVKVNPLKPLNEKQRVYMQLLEEVPVVVATGYAGTSKTFTPTAMAADLLKLGKIDKLIVTRPAISSSKSVGYTVGSHSEKMQSWLGGVIPILKERLGSAAMQIQVDAGNIEFVPLETVKGLSINNAWMLVEEASDLTKEEVIKLITRMGKNSKLVLAGDIRQSELKEESGLAWLCKFLERNQNLQKNFGLVDFDSTSDIVRSEAVKSFIIALVKEEKSSGIKSK